MIPTPFDCDESPHHRGHPAKNRTVYETWAHPAKSGNHGGQPTTAGSSGSGTSPLKPTHRKVRDVWGTLTVLGTRLFETWAFQCR